QIVEGLALGEAFPVLLGELAEFRVAHVKEVFLDRVDLVRDPLELAQEFTLARPENLIDDCWPSRKLLADPCGTAHHSCCHRRRVQGWCRPARDAIRAFN